MGILKSNLRDSRGLTRALIISAGFFAVPPLVAQEINEPVSVGGFQVSRSLIEGYPVLNVEQNSVQDQFQATLADRSTSLNLGLTLSPSNSLNIRADAWRLEVDEANAASLGIDSSAQEFLLPRLYLEDNAAASEINLQTPFLGSVESSGFDLGASYAWNTDQFGQFTLSSKTTYIAEFENRPGILGMPLSTTAGGPELVNPELQSSLMLSWQFGNHSASAITNYVDSFKDLSEMNIDEINEFVDSITTIDLQYGYSIKTGSNDNRAIISFGIRNVFDEKTNQLLNATKQILDQNGRVAYGSIKYQF